MANYENQDVGTQRN